MTVDFPAMKKLGFEFEVDAIASQEGSSFIRTTGIGDSRLTVQLDVLDKTKRAPSFAVSYFVKTPSASVVKGLGSGRVDHKVTSLFSENVGGTKIDFNAALLINGRSAREGHMTGGEYSLAFSRNLNKKFNLLGEIFGETKDPDQPKGLFVSSVGSYQISRKSSFNCGLVRGITPSSPRLGLKAGVTLAVGYLYRKL